MSEKLFRAKIDQKYGNTTEWIYGMPYINENDDCVITSHNSTVVVQENTLGLYTGCVDVNGTKIFEGDIFLDKFYNLPTNIGIVCYGGYCNAFNSDPYCLHIGFYVDWNDDLKIMRKDLGFWCKCREVVGNIFDNPGLLKIEVTNNE